MSRKAVVALLLAGVVAGARAVLTCRAACHACRARTHPHQVLDIYCAMCHECKDRRKDLLRSKIETARQRRVETNAKVLDVGKLENTDKESMNVNDDSSDGHSPHRYSIVTFSQSPKKIKNEFSEPIPNANPNKQCPITAHDHNLPLIRRDGPVVVEIPEGCPTPPPCSDDEGMIVKIKKTTTTTPAPTTTTTPVPCPLIKPCKKRTTTPPPPPPPCLMPMPCAPMCPMYPAFPPPCFASNPPPGFPYNPPPGYLTYPTPTSLPATFKTSTDNEYVYVYVGLPKNAIRKSGVKSNSITKTTGALPQGV